jgi:hypothetical protein
MTVAGLPGMNRMAAICILFLALPVGASAMKEGPITDYFHGADFIYLVRVESLDANPLKGSGLFKGSARFAVTETLRGEPVASLTLTPGDIELQKGSEFLILSSDASRHGQMGHVVGSLFKGNVGWQDAPFVRDSGQVYVLVWPKGDKTMHGRTYLTLEHVKNLLKQDSAK